MFLFGFIVFLSVSCGDGSARFYSFLKKNDDPPLKLNALRCTVISMMNKTSLFINRSFLELILVFVFFLFILGMQHANAQSVPKQDAWTVRCNKGADQECEMFQRLIEKESGKRFIELAIGYPGDSDVARGVFILPLGLIVNEEVTFQIDDGPLYSFKVRYCLPDGCYAFIDLNDKVLADMKKGLKIELALKSYDGKNMRFPLSLVGFSKALKRVNAS